MKVLPSLSLNNLDFSFIFYIFAKLTYFNFTIMIDTIYFEMMADYLAQASEEEKRNFINSHRSFEYFYLKNGYFDHRKDFRNSVGEYLAQLSGKLDKTIKEVGLEDNETYYPRIVEELIQQHALLEENKKEVEAYVPINA